MKLLVFVLLLPLPALGQEQKQPEEMTQEEKAEVAQYTIEMQAAALQLSNAVRQLEQRLAPLRQRAQLTTVLYEKVVEDYQKRYGAEHCQLSSDQKWLCQEPQPEPEPDEEANDQEQVPDPVQSDNAVAPGR